LTTNFDKLKPRVESMVEQNKQYQADSSGVMNRLKVQVSNLNRIREETEKGLQRSMRKNQRAVKGFKDAMNYFSEDGPDVELIHSERSNRFSRGESLEASRLKKRNTCKIDYTEIKHLSTSSGPEKKYWPQRESSLI
jgi:hypothetical protein